ncbi:MAG: hypothetical protein NW703_05550 [Nitrospiraceae bacterium]
MSIVVMMDGSLGQDRTRTRVWSPVLLGLGLVMALSWSPSTSALAEEPVQLSVAVHVHSEASTGTLSLESIAQRAEQLGLDAVIFTENLALRYEYGLPPFRSLLRFVREFPSLLDYGIARYVAELKDVQSRHPAVILIPGIEAAPYAYWTGSLWSGDLTLHDTQKNLLVFGLKDPAHYRQLPAIGNPAAYHVTAETVLVLVLPPLLMTLATVMGLRDRREIREGLVARLSRPRLLAMCSSAVVGATLLWAAWPIGRPPYPIYDSGQGYRPYQQFIETARDAGGLTFWSMVEARDREIHSFGPLGDVTVTTEPHPDALILTDRYTGFGGLYQEAHRAIQPGQIWDQTIELFLRGERPASPVMLGEIAFHSPDHAGKDLDQVLSIVSVRSRTADALLNAVRAGTLYAVERRKKEFALRLETFRIECDGGRRHASMGEILDPEGQRDVVIRASISATDRQAHPITVTLIRSGETLSRQSGATPLAIEFPDKTAPAERWLAYRILVEGEGELVSNPVFVGPMPSTQLATTVSGEARL